MKRNRLEIIKDILEIIRKNYKIKPTPLLRKTNISSSNFKEYYNELIAKEFVKEINNTEEKYVEITPKGIRYLEKYKSIVGFIEEFEL